MKTVNLFEKLKHIVKVEINWNAPLIDIKIVKDSYKVESDNRLLGKEQLYLDEDKSTAYLNIDALDEKQKEKLKPVLQEYLEEGNKLLQIDTSDLLESLYNHSKDKTDLQIVEFFDEIISKDDLEALQASLYLRTVFSQGKNVTKLKGDIRDAFGNRGNNIANLTSGGYFEKFLMPLYNATKDDGKTFKELYEQIVEKAILTVFVYRDMNPEEIPKEIKAKIQISKKYGIDFIHIHGIGEANVLKIKECLEEHKEEFFDFFEKKVFEKDNIIIIELLLNKAN